MGFYLIRCWPIQGWNIKMCDLWAIINSRVEYTFEDAAFGSSTLVSSLDANEHFQWSASLFKIYSNPSEEKYLNFLYIFFKVKRSKWWSMSWTSAGIPSGKTYFAPWKILSSCLWRRKQNSSSQPPMRVANFKWWTMSNQKEFLVIKWHCSWLKRLPSILQTLGREKSP